MKHSIRLSINPLVRRLGKPASEFMKSDIIRLIDELDIHIVNFMYPAADGRLKTLTFPVTDIDYLETILTCGERVDGSSLFRHISAGSSDLYVVPRFRTAFLDPFAPEPTLTMLCSFFDKDGRPLPGAPEQVLMNACAEFKRVTGYNFECMGELEFYVIGDDPSLFTATDQKGYHESGPFAKFGSFRTRCLAAIARTGALIKYGHSEVGNFSMDGKIYEQNEIEFLPTAACDAADQLVIAKWVIRNMAYEEGLDVTFAPKITVGKAGSGLHIHMKFTDDSGRNMMLRDGRLSDDAKRGIAGMMMLARSITAFGNTVPTSYLRLVPHQEAPTSVCWGDRNRSVLVRVPLGWTSGTDMCHEANPFEPSTHYDASSKQTVEIRSADCSADVYMLMAALAVACRKGFENHDALAIAERTYVDVNIHAKGNEAKLESLECLPASCVESAECLEEQRGAYEECGVFTPSMIDATIAGLRGYDDARLRDTLDSTENVLKLVNTYFHCG